MNTNENNDVRRAHWIWPVLFTALLSACGTAHRVTVDSLARENTEQKISYRLRDKSSLSGSPQADAAGVYVKTALSGRGLYEAPANATPDLILEVDYGVKVLRTQSRRILEPIWDGVPKQAQIKVTGSGADEVVERVPPPTQLRERVIIDTIYEKYLRLTAHESQPAAPGRPPNEIWTVDVLSEGMSNDLRKQLPVLVAASIDYIGHDTHGQKTIRIKDTDADVVFVKKGL